jgi:hypothetical protein
MPTTKAKFSEHGLNSENAVDVSALSIIARDRLDTRRVVIATASGQKQTAVFTQNATVKHTLGPVGIPGTLRTAHISFETKPAGGTLTVFLVAYDASANAEIVLTDALDPETAVDREGLAFVLAATNVELAADDTLELHTTASNDAIGTAALGVSVATVWTPTEATVTR